MDRGQRAAHIVWDWNGTLLHDTDAVLEATNAANAELGLPALTLERYRDLYCLPLTRFYERLLGRVPTSHEWEVLDAVFQRCYGDRLHTLDLTEGAARLLAERRSAGWTQSLCSLAPHDQLMPLLRTHGIDGHFLRVDGNLDRQITSKALQMARHLAALDGVSAERIVVIGDALDDAVAAAHIGARAVLYTGGAHSRSSLRAAGVPVVDTLTAAVELAEQLVT